MHPIELITANVASSTRTFHLFLITVRFIHKNVLKIEKMKNREIKFRAWNNSHNEMIEWTTLNQSAFNRNTTHLLYHVLVVEPTLYSIMQYTGLKDKFGVEIYEGDVVLFKDNLCKVYYEFAGFRISPLPNIDVNSINTNKDFEVIGNLYENPELIK